MGTAAARIAAHYPYSGIAHRLDQRIGVLGRVIDLRDIDHRGRAHVEERQRRRQHASVGVRGLIMKRDVFLNVAIVIGIHDAVWQRIAQQALIGVAVGIDETRNDDPIGDVDHDNGLVRGGDIGPHIADLAVLDQNIPGREVADLRIDGQDDATLEQNAACVLHPVQLRIGIGCCGALRGCRPG
jgi:hypothetical protein